MGRRQPSATRGVRTTPGAGAGVYARWAGDGARSSQAHRGREIVPCRRPAQATSDAIPTAAAQVLAERRYAAGRPMDRRNPLPSLMTTNPVLRWSNRTATSSLDAVICELGLHSIG